MRDVSSWCRGIEKKLRNDLSGGSLTPRKLLEIELALHLLQRVAPGDTTDAVPALLSGYPFVRGHEMAIANARAILPTLKNPYAWRTILAQYEGAPEHLRGFALEAARMRARRLDVSLASDRFAVFDRTLESRLPHRREQRELADAGTWFLRARAGWTSVRVPEGLLDGRHAGPVHGDLPPPRLSVPPIDADWEELLATARWIDDASRERNLPARDWEGCLRRATLEEWAESPAGFIRARRLRIVRRLHMVGMVSSGKSTLMDVLAVWGARRGLRVVLVVGDVVSAVRRTTLFRQLGLSAAPILGRSNRRRHAERLHRLHAAEGRRSVLDMADPAFDFLSTACGLDALREHETSFDVGQTPCEDFYPAGDDGGPAEGTPRVCPFYAGCQQHEGTRTLTNASIWITTPAALVYTQVPGPTMAERLRYGELVYRTADLVVVDEADQVQVQLDLAFSPHESLFGGSQGSWFDDLEERVGRELRSSRRRPLTDPDVGRWVNALDVARAAGNRIYTLLNQHPALRRWIERRHFTEWSIAAMLAREWSGVADDDESVENEATERFRSQFREFNLHPFGDQSGAPSALVALAQSCLTAPDDLEVRGMLEHWIAELPGITIPKSQFASAAVRLELLLLVAVLANRLELLIRMWRQVELPLHLDGNSVLFHRPPEDFRQVIPDSPMGNQLGFQYLSGEEDTGRGPTGELRFFRCMGVGRWLLLNLHSLFDADGTQGPNVLLLSGTSWSGAAPGHHLQIPVGALLRARQAEVDAIAQSRFEYRPFFDSVTNKPLRVSGNRSPQDRRSSLFKILAHLAGPGRLDRGPSRLDRDLQALPERRRRALLLVGSYVDARAALQDLIQIDPSWRDRAVCLIPDDDDEGAGDEYISTLRRGEVERFGRGSPDVLIAPLMAVERGHNILNEEQRAAVGAVYMLVRPMPRPDDISFPVLFLNRWAVERSTRSVEGERSVAQDGAEFRQEAFDLWRRLLGAPMSWAGLDQETREALTWSQLVSLWQVIGRLVRGGEPARVYFVDAAFAPHSAADAERGDSPTSSILLSLRAVLDPYFTDSSIPSREREIARTLYGPLREALSRLEGVTIDGHV